MKRQNIYLVLLIGAALFTEQARADLMIQDYDADLHNRYNDSREFLGNPHDWSGIGRLTGGGSWATLISPSYFLSATHAHPSPTSSVRFYKSNDDSSGAFEDRTVDSGIQIVDSDLWLGKLSTPVSAAIGTFPIVAPAGLTGQTIYVFGQSGSTGMRLGRNVIAEVIHDYSSPSLGDSLGDVFIYDYDTVDGLGADESRFQGGDSGGPSFAIVDGQPAILGIHWFIYEVEDMLTPEIGSGDTLVSSYLDQLATNVVGESLTVVAIPEPAAVWLMFLIAVLAIAKSRRYSGTKLWYKA